MEHSNSESLHIDKLIQVARTKTFLGREFLTWLWYYVDTAPDSVKVPSGQDKRSVNVSFWIDDRILLDSVSGHQNLMRGGDPAHSPEASIALATGKTVKELKLGFHVKGVGDFSANLNSSDLCPRSVRLPGNDLLGDDEDSSFLPIQQRIKQTALLLSIIDHLFETFLDLRLSSAWINEHQNDMKEWIHARSSNMPSQLKNILH